MDHWVNAEEHFGSFLKCSLMECTSTPRVWPGQCCSRRIKQAQSTLALMFVPELQRSLEKPPLSVLWCLQSALRAPEVTHHVWRADAGDGWGCSNSAVDELVSLDLLCLVLC